MSMWISAGNKDYQLTTVQLRFSPSQEYQCLNIAILDDTILESEEDFQATLNTVMERVILDPDTATITVADDDGKQIISDSATILPSSYWAYMSFVE